LQSGNHAPSILQNLLKRGRRSSGDSSSEEEEEEDEIGDMGLFGPRLEQFKATHPHINKQGLGMGLHNK
jgi:hypothetical protein